MVPKKFLAFTLFLNIAADFSLSIFPVAMIFSGQNSWAASSSDVEVESLYDQFDKEEQREKKRLKQQDQERNQEQNQGVLEEKSTSSRPLVNKRDNSLPQEKSDPYDTLAELQELAPYQDIAVIQRRFIPKINRFELGGSLSDSINNAFFNNYGLGVHGTFYFTEKYGIELMYMTLFNSQKDITQNLETVQGIEARSLVVPESFMGAHFKWSPIYGKMALFNKKIVPFDIYFSIGGGLSKTKMGESDSTISLGTGQSFALSKSMSVSWDLLLNNYSASVLVESTPGNFEEAKANHTDVFLSVGMSFYFPDADYR